MLFAVSFFQVSDGLFQNYAAIITRTNFPRLVVGVNAFYAILFRLPLIDTVVRYTIYYKKP